MNRFTCMAYVMVGLVAVVGLAHAAQSGEETAVHAVTVNWEKAYNQYNAKALAALYSDDAQSFPPHAPAAHGKAGILAFFTKEAAESKADGITTTISEKTDIAISGDMAWESGAFKAAAKGEVIAVGKWLSVYRKSNGKWLIVRDTWNTDDEPGAKQ